MAASQTDHSSLCFPIQRRMAAFQLVFGTIINSVSVWYSPFPLSKYIPTQRHCSHILHKHFVLSLQLFIFQDIYNWMFEVFWEGHELTTGFIFQHFILTSLFSTFDFQQSCRKSLWLLGYIDLTWGATSSNNSHRFLVGWSAGFSCQEAGSRWGSGGRLLGTAFPPHWRAATGPWQRWHWRGGTGPTRCSGYSCPKTQCPEKNSIWIRLDIFHQVKFVVNVSW